MTKYPNALIVSNLQIRRDTAGRYCLNDLHDAAGGDDRHRPARWIRSQQTQELINEVDARSTTANNKLTISGQFEAVKSTEGRGGGTFVAKPLVYAYAMWVSAHFHLAVIDAYDALVTSDQFGAGQVAVTSNAALHRIRLQAVTRLYRARHPSEQAALFDQAAQLSLDLGLPVPELPAAMVTTTSVLQAFWTLADMGLASGTLQNHARRDDVLAFNLPQVRQHAARSGIALPESTALTGALRACPRLLHVNRAYNSPAIGRAVKCWVFAK